MDDEALVAFAKEGHHEAFEELRGRHFHRAFQTVNRITRSHPDAEDALQDTFLSAYANLDTFGGRAKFSTWLTRIATNSALMILRRKRIRPQAALHTSIDGETWEEWDIPDDRMNIEASYARKETTVHLKAAISWLRPALRNVLDIYHENNGTLEETAAIAGLTVPATKAQLTRARRVLRQRLARWA